MAPDLFLGKDQAAVNGYVEHPAGRLHQGDFGSELVPQLRRQTGGAGLVVSDDAILDRYLHVFSRQRDPESYLQREGWQGSPAGSIRMNG